MPSSRPQLHQQRLEQTYRESCEIVRRAHERAEAAAARAHQMRETARTQRAKGGAALARLAAEEARRASLERERFVAVVSHELRQPLNAALAAFSLIEAKASRETSEKASRVIGRQLLHMSRLLDDLLDMSRLTMDRLRLQMGVIDLRRPIESAIETIAPRAAERRHHLHVSLPEQAVNVHGDAARLHQVFANLLSNAVRYTPSGGEISVSLRFAGDRAVTDVADTGQGIAAEDLERIFEAFSRGSGAAADGLGIGLTLVRGLVRLHGGTVAAASPGPDRGSIFTVALRVVP